MRRRQRSVGSFLQGLMLWGVVVGMAIHLFVTPVLASAALNDGRTCMAAEVHDASVLHTSSVNQARLSVVDELQFKAATPSLDACRVGEDGLTRRASSLHAGEATGSDSLVMLGIRLQI